MVSIGGLDLGYGSQMQMVRTNVLYLPMDSTGITTAAAEKVHNLAVQRFPSQLKPDFTTAETAAGTAALTLTDEVAGGLLEDMATVPLGLASGSYGDTADNRRSSSIEAILNVGVVSVAAGTGSSADDLFTADSPNVISGDELQAFAGQVYGAHLAAVLNGAESGEARPTVIDTIDLDPVIADLGLSYAVNQDASNGIDSLTDGSEAASTAGSTLAELKTAIAGASLVSVLSLCKVQ